MLSLGCSVLGCQYLCKWLTGKTHHQNDLRWVAGDIQRHSFIHFYETSLFYWPYHTFALTDQVPQRFAHKTFRHCCSGYRCLLMYIPKKPFTGTSFPARQTCLLVERVVWETCQQIWRVPSRLTIKPSRRKANVPVYLSSAHSWHSGSVVESIMWR